MNTCNFKQTNTCVYIDKCMLKFHFLLVNKCIKKKQSHNIYIDFKK